MIKFNKKFGKATEAGIDSFQEKFNIRMPRDYKQFLLNINGGAPDKYWVPFEDDGDYISHFYGIHDGDNWLKLEHAVKDFAEAEPIRFIPVAISNGGNYFIMRINGENRGKIYFWDHDEEDFEPPTFDFLIEISDTFNLFLDLIE